MATRWHLHSTHTTVGVNMAKADLTLNPKFRLLCYLTKEPTPHVLGHLELMWTAAHTALSPVFRNAQEVEAAAEWDGDQGALARALVDTRFLDLHQDGTYKVHNYWDHAPQWVKQRADRAGIDWRDPEQPTPATSSNGGKHTDVDWWFDLYNQTAANHGLPMVAKVTKDRRAKARQRMNDHGRDAMEQVLQEVATSKFLQGQGGRDTWTGATADWLLGPRNFVKVLEGQYRDRQRRPRGGGHGHGGGYDHF